MRLEEGYSIKTCTVCGKKFTILDSVDEWAWRYRENYLCSYTCFRKAERGEVPTLWRGTQRKRGWIPLYDEIAKLKADGLTYRQIADKLGISEGSVWYGLKMAREHAEQTRGGAEDG